LILTLHIGLSAAGDDACGFLLYLGDSSSGGPTKVAGPGARNHGVV